MDYQQVFVKVRCTISESCGIDEDLILPGSTLFDDLAVDSIDMVDILFVLENNYKIALKLNDIQREVSKEMGDAPYEIDGIITEMGIEAIKRKFPEFDKGKLTTGISVHQLVHLITVQSLTNQVLTKINETAKAPE